MQSLSNAFSAHSALFWLALVLAFVGVTGWLARTAAHLRRLQAQFDDLFAGAAADGTARMLTEYLTTVRHTAAAVNRIKTEHDKVAHIFPRVVRHVGLVRFSPFHDTGGDQSFALALLDGRGDGVVITALHSRHDSRLYAKPIEGGNSRYSLTPEEREAMQRAWAEEIEPAVP